MAIISMNYPLPEKKKSRERERGRKKQRYLSLQEKKI
jgi:hypothetical protein